MNIKTLAAFVFAFFSTFSFAHTQATQRAPALYPAVSCNTKQAVDGLRSRLISRGGHDFYDGDAPWPGVYGVWVDEERGIYLTLRGKRPFARSALRLSAVINSLCDDRELARGQRLFLASDWTAKQLELKIKGSSFFREDLILRFSKVEVIKSKKQRPVLEVQIFNLNATESMLIDRFKASKIE